MSRTPREARAALVNLADVYLQYAREALSREDFRNYELWVAASMRMKDAALAIEAAA